MSETHEHAWIEATSHEDRGRRYLCDGCGREKREARDRMVRDAPRNRQITNPGRTR